MFVREGKGWDQLLLAFDLDYQLHFRDQIQDKWQAGNQLTLSEIFRAY